MQDMHNPTTVSRLSASDAATLYIWLAQQYPHSTDPDDAGTSFTGPREAVGHYRDSVLQAIEYRGTNDAVAAVVAIAAALPELEWMKWVIAEARKATRRAMWRPPAPRDLIKLTQQPHTRLVQTAAQLQDVILESLAELQAELQGETPAAPDLWDQISPDKFRPKDENHLSDYVMRHLKGDLDRRGIVAMREVEIRRGEGSAQGERTDIHVTGIVPGLADGEYEQVRVILEDKGSWNKDVETAMQTQLVERYLRDNQCRHGIYLVGWYHCDQWDKDDPRYKKSRKEGFQVASARFNDQAIFVSNDSCSIKSVVLNAALR